MFRTVRPSDCKLAAGPKKILDRNTIFRYLHIVSDVQEGNVPRFLILFFQLALVVTLAVPVSAASLARAGKDPHLANFHFFMNRPPANEFPMSDVDGNPITLRDLRGNVVLLNFWRRACHYCKREKGLLRKMVKEINASDLVVLCVDLWDSPKWVRRDAKAFAGDLLFATRYGRSKAFMENVVRGRPMGFYILNRMREAVYEVKGFPTTYVIDKEGRVIAGHLGMARWDVPSIRRWMEKLLTASPTRLSAAGEYELPNLPAFLLGGPVQADKSGEQPIRGPRAAPR
jgi:peroxiredoxin